MRTARHEFPIAPILRELGAENVPDVKAGRHQKMLCPFHADSRPSATVSRYGFICWACDRRGDAIKLIREEEGLSYADAVARCAALTGVENRGGGTEPGWGASLLD